MAVTFYDLTSVAGLKKLDDFLLSRSYISGYQASNDDLTVYSALSSAPSAEHVNVYRWYTHIDALLRISFDSGVFNFVFGSAVVVSKLKDVELLSRDLLPSQKRQLPLLHLLRQRQVLIFLVNWRLAAEDDDDDDVDLFGEETEEEKKAAEERAATVKAASKKKESGKSSVLLDVKPWDDETDMKKLEEAVRSVEMEGLLWGASKLVPVGYGIKKLTIMLTIIDDLVSVDTLIEERLTTEPINEYVQSCDIVAFNKISGLRWVIGDGKSISFWYDIGPHAQWCSMHCRDLASMWIKRLRQSHMEHMGKEFDIKRGHRVGALKVKVLLSFCLLLLSAL
ncbi:hypothetical protein NC652_035222 [Populus alba x Populus x berolinensis]|nr:hypothetical protein NC652_035219 [Populus alba x Populus x berolinensis]KAJ6875781.1 hypothetical protein NC652_035222 [Populus alba x Populus x berolinensis]